MAVGLTVADKKWQAESDARTLVDAELIKNDPKKMKAAAKAAERMAKEEMAKAKAMQNIAGIKTDTKPAEPKITRSVSKRVQERAKR